MLPCLSTTQRNEKRSMWPCTVRDVPRKNVEWYFATSHFTSGIFRLGIDQILSNSNFSNIAVNKHVQNCQQPELTI